eukprot:2905077-Prymnesium_polylepis.1
MPGRGGAAAVRRGPARAASQPVEGDHRHGDARRGARHHTCCRPTEPPAEQDGVGQLGGAACMLSDGGGGRGGRQTQHCGDPAVRLRCGQPRPQHRGQLRGAAGSV